MKANLKFINVLTLALTLTIIGCSNDDDATVTPVNQISVQDLMTTIDENPTNGDVVGTVQTTQTVGGATLTFSISSQTPSGALNINTTTGELTIADASLFDYETNSTITATISVTGSVDIGTTTISLNDIAEIGEFKYGGVIFWVDPTNNAHGLVCAVSNQSYGAVWGCYGTLTGANISTIGGGSTNTVTIETYCTTTGTAADLAANLNLNGYNDWFLPNQDELHQLYLNKDVVNTTALANGGEVPNQNHWTSTEDNGNGAVLVNLTTGLQYNGNKSVSFGVRSVRAF